MRKGRAGRDGGEAGGGKVGLGGEGDVDVRVWRGEGGRGRGRRLVKLRQPWDGVPRGGRGMKGRGGCVD